MINTQIKITLSLALLLSNNLNASQISFESSENQTQLIELYTSQGCSSCPPADNKISKLIASPKLWKDFIPVAFHVNYWDYLGWKDIYSQQSSTDRQKSHYRFANSNNVYTPQFVINGKEWRGFFKGQKFPTSAPKKVGKLSLDLNIAQQQISLTFKPSTTIKATRCHFALLSFDSNVAIKSGENQGLTMQQNFSAIEYLNTSIEIKNHDYHCRLSTPLFNNAIATQQKTNNTQKLALIGWVETNNLQSIQATGGWITL